MAQIKVVSDAADPKAGKERKVSGATAPYMNLALSEEVARVIHVAGGSLDREQLAAKLSYSGTKNGTFLMRVSAAKIFGLVDQPPQSDIVRITPRGVSIVAPVSEVDAQRAKLEAFMCVDLYKAVYMEYKGRELPANIGLANLLVNTYKIIPNRAAPAVKTMLESAETAGLFSMAGLASRKMISPILSGGGGAAVVDPPKIPLTPQVDTTRSVSGGGGGNDGGDGIDPALSAILRRLPPSGTPLSKSKRKTLIEALISAVNWIYPDPDAEADDTM